MLWQLALFHSFLWLSSYIYFKNKKCNLMGGRTKTCHFFLTKEMSDFLKDTEALYHCESIRQRNRKAVWFDISRPFIPSRWIVFDLKTWSTWSATEVTITNKYVKRSNTKILWFMSSALIFRVGWIIKRAYKILHGIFTYA